MLHTTFTMFVDLKTIDLSRQQKSFRVIHEIDNIGIFAQLLMEIKLETAGS